MVIGGICLWGRRKGRAGKERGVRGGERRSRKEREISEWGIMIHSVRCAPPFSFPQWLPFFHLSLFLILLWWSFFISPETERRASFSPSSSANAKGRGKKRGGCALDSISSTFFSFPVRLFFLSKKEEKGERSVVSGIRYDSLFLPPFPSFSPLIFLAFSPFEQTFFREVGSRRRRRRSSCKEPRGIEEVEVGREGGGPLTSTPRRQKEEEEEQ